MILHCSDPGFVFMFSFSDGNITFQSQICQISMLSFPWWTVDLVYLMQTVSIFILWLFELQRAQTEAVTFLGNQDSSRSLYAIPGLDYVAHEDILPYTTTEKQPLHHELFDKFLMYYPDKGTIVFAAHMIGHDLWERFPVVMHVIWGIIFCKILDSNSSIGDDSCLLGCYAVLAGK